MALINPQKNFRWRLEISGITAGGGFNDLAQDITLPEAEFTETIHGSPGNNPDIKTPNKIGFTDLVISKLVKEDTPDNWAWGKLASALTGVPGAFRFDGFLNETDGSGRITRRYILQNCWVKKLTHSNKVASNEDADNSFEEVTISVGAFYPDALQSFKNAFGG